MKEVLVIHSLNDSRNTEPYLRRHLVYLPQFRESERQNPPESGRTEVPLFLGALAPFP